MSETINELSSTMMEQLKANKELPVDSGDTTVADLLYFSRPIYQIPPKILFRTMAKLIKETFMISFSTLGSQILVTSGFFLLNYISDNEGQAALGIAMTYNVIFFYGLFLSISEKAGIDMSQAFGAKRYDLTKKVFTQGAITNASLFLLTTVPIFLLAEHILVFANIDPKAAYRCQKILTYMLVADAIELAGDYIRAFCMAQGFETVFGATSLLSFIISAIFGYILVVVYSFGPIGWVMSKFIYETILLLVALVAMTACHPQTIGVTSLSLASEGLCNFVWQSIKFALGSYSEFLGYEIASYFVFRTHDNSQIAAYSAILNFASIFYATGETFAIICRTRMNILIGKDLKRTSKNFFIFYILVLFILGAIIGLICYFIREEITYLYAGNNEYMSESFEKLFIVYCFCIACELSITTVFMGIKTIGGIGCLLLMNFSLFIGGNFVLCYYLTVVKGWGSLAIFIGLQSIFYLESILSVCRVVFTDWTKCELIKEEEEPSGDALMADDVEKRDSTPKKKIDLDSPHRQDTQRATVANLVLC